MKKTVKKDELPDIAEWINSHQRRAVPPERQPMTYTFYLPATEAAVSSRHTVSGWIKATAIIGLATASAALGAYLCNGYLVPPPPKQYRAPIVHEVAPGDTLWSVASEYGDASQDVRETYYRIMKDNDADAGNLRPGQRLVIYREGVNHE